MSSWRLETIREAEDNPPVKYARQGRERIAQNGVERGAGAVSSFTEDAYE